MKGPLSPANLERSVQRAAAHFSQLLIRIAEDYGDAATQKNRYFASVGLGSPLEFSIAARALDSILKQEYKALAQRAVVRVKDYVNQFDVREKGYDYYKCTYFYVMECLHHIRGSEERYRVLASLGLIYIMDDILEADWGKRMHANMRVKLLNSMAYRSKTSSAPYPWMRLYGTYGIYMIFKNISKSCQICELRRD